MRIVGLGAGPANLYASILFRKAFPDCSVVLHERNREDDTFGFGVVFSDETLGHFKDADPESFAAITARFARWTDIDTWFRGEWTVSTGHGFCGLARVELLKILGERARALGVDIRYGTEITDPTTVPDADLVLCGDGVASAVRTKWADMFRPTVTQGKARFAWLGTTKPLKAFTFVFAPTEHGPFAVHAYPYRTSPTPLSTWIVECHEDTWRKSGLDRCDEPETKRRMEALFEPWLDGHPLLINRSIWRSFPTVTCERWNHGKYVLLGDASHTAHFSIGSGTKLAMEDAIALVDAFKVHGTKDVPKTLDAFTTARRPETLKLQKAAKTSREWFENVARYEGQSATQFTFNLMTRSRRITYGNLAKRDPALVDRTARAFALAAGLAVTADGPVVPPVFTPFRLRDMTVPNRFVVSPMCQYSAKDGTPDDWHLVHLGSRAVGGAGLLIAEATAVTPDGRITPGCTGLWNDAHEAAWKRVVDFVHGHSASKIGIQIGHAGAKASCRLLWEGGAPLAAPDAWPTIGVTSTPFNTGDPAPRAVDRADMDRLVEAFMLAARRADRAGFDLLELHMAHGYLLSSFLSPLSNTRTDAYGGTLENRMRFPLEIAERVRAVWPAAKPLSVRLSASDWLDEAGGQTVDDSIVIAAALKARGVDVIDVSSAGNSLKSKPEYGRMYQASFADAIRHGAGVPVIAVGGISDGDQANTLLAAGACDLVAIARAHLGDPYLALHAAAGLPPGTVAWPKQYLAVRR